MVKLICGDNGSGKTRKMLEMANNEVENIQGKMAFIEASNKHIFKLNHKIRYVNTKEYGLINEDQFQGFVCGLLATDYDLEKVYIDGLYKIADVKTDESVKILIEKLEDLAKKFEVEFVISINYENDNIPEMFKDKILS